MASFTRSQGVKIPALLIAMAEGFVLLLSIAMLWFSWQRLTHTPSGHELVLRSNTYCEHTKLSVELKGKSSHTLLAPLLDRLTVHMRDVQLRSALLNEHNTPPSIHRQKPSLDVDAAWTYLTHGGRNFLITADEVRKLGKDHETAAYIADAKGPLSWFFLEHCSNC